MTAGTLGLEEKHEFVYRALVEIDEANQSNALDFEGFITELTKKIVIFFLTFRVILLQKKVDKLTSSCSTDMEKASLTSLTWDTSMSNSTTDSMTPTWMKLFTPLQALKLTPFQCISSAGTWPAELRRETQKEPKLHDGLDQWQFMKLKHIYLKMNESKYKMNWRSNKRIKKEKIEKNMRKFWTKDVSQLKIKGDKE